ncbi:MAG TPA: M56 family metallopeptidase [Pirellulales bacterium]|nr:M56 family metallopeptidase [Pirellulales bacterium]
MTWLMTSLVAIGLANALWAALFAVAAVGCGRWLRRPALAHLLWIVVLGKLLTPGVIQLPLDAWLGRPSGWLSDAVATITALDADEPSASRPAARELEHSLALRSSQESATAGELRSQSAAAAPAASERSTAPIASESAASDVVAGNRRLLTAAGLIRFAAALWLLGSTAMAVWMARRAWRFYAFLKLAGRGDASLQARLDRLARRAGIKSAPRLVVVENVVSPMLWGLGSPGFACGARLVFPGPLARRLDDESCDALLLHELAHYARGDGWVRLLELAAQTLYWWHPLVWLARGEIEAAEEECGDAWALEHQTGTRRLYAEALLATVDFLYEPPLAPLPPAACGLGEAPLLRRRLTQIMGGGAAKSASRPAKALVLAAAAVVLPLRPTFFGAAPRPALANSSPAATAALVAAKPTPQTAPAASSQMPRKTTPREIDPLAPRRRSVAHAPSPLWAAAASHNGKYQLEARTGRKTTLVHVESGWRLDLTAHQIACASFSPDGRTFATGHDDCAVRIWDSETGGLLTSLKDGESPIVSVAFAPDGQRVAAGGADGGVHVWDWAQANEVAKLARQAAPVSCVRWSPRGDRLAVAFGRWSDGEDAALALWSPGDDAPLELHGFGDPIGALDWLDDDSLLLAAWDGESLTFSVSLGKPLARLRLDKNSVSAAAWSPDCRLVAQWQAERLVAEVDPPSRTEDRR